MLAHPALFTVDQLLAAEEQNPQDFLDGMRAREEYILEYGFVAVTDELLTSLAAMLRGLKVLEAGAGSGYLSASLASRGIDILASDHEVSAGINGKAFRVWRRDHRGDSVQLLPGEFDAVVMSWPPLRRPFAARVAAAMRPGQLLFFEGEECTADRAFFENLASDEWEHLDQMSRALSVVTPRFTGIRDRWTVARKRQRAG